MDFTNISKNPIMLKEENKRFAFERDKEIRGYIKLETDGDKGLMVVTVENVKFFPRGEYSYKLILTGVKKEKRHYHMVGNISLSAYGKGEGSFRINPRDLDGQGLSLRDFSTAIIAAMSMVNHREALHPVLSGELSAPGEKSARPATPKDYSPFYNRFVLENCIGLAKEQDRFTDILPFDHDLTGATWKKVTDSKLFPIISPGSKAPIAKYGHFLFGWQGTHYFLGVPGRFFPDEQPDGGKSGFAFWQPIMGMEEKAQDGSLPVDERRKEIYGYWIAAINRFNGHIEELPHIPDNSSGRSK